MIERAALDPEARRTTHDDAREELRIMEEKKEELDGIRPDQGQTRVEREAASDALEREKLTQSLVQLIRQRKDDEPLAIGLFGHWGAGKSSQIRFVRQTLPAGPDHPVRVADFNAWEHERCENIAAALAQTVVDALLQDVDLGGQVKLAVRMAAMRRSRTSAAAAHKLKHGWAALRSWLVGGLPALWPALLMLLVLLFLLFSPGTALSGFARSAATSLAAVTTVLIGVFSSSRLVAGNLTEWFKRLNPGDRLGLFKLPDYEAKLGALHEIKTTLANLCTLRLGATRIAGKQIDTLLIVIDDLDRCMPKTVKEVFDAVRLVANLPRVVTILAIDDRIAFAAVEKHYDQFGFAGRDSGQVARDYLAKVFQASLSVPPISAAAAKNYVFRHLFGFTETSEAQANWDKNFDAMNGDRTAPLASDASIKGEAQTPLPVALKLEARLFGELASKTGIVNPRDLWRMKQAWFMLKAMALDTGARMEQMRPLLEALFMREWLLRSSMQSRQRITNLLNAAALPAEAGAPADPEEAAYVAWAREHGNLGAMVDLVLLPGAPTSRAEVAKSAPSVAA